MNVYFLDVAEQEFNDAVEYYESEQAGLGIRFKTEVAKTLSRITAYPNAYQKLSKRTRRCLVAKFPYGIIYQKTQEEILIIAIANLHRKLGYWIARKT